MLQGTRNDIYFSFSCTFTIQKLTQAKPLTRFCLTYLQMEFSLEDTSMSPRSHQNDPQSQKSHVKLPENSKTRVHQVPTHSYVDILLVLSRFDWEKERHAYL